MGETVKVLLEKGTNWSAPTLPEHIPSGDMPGDSVQIGDGHIAKAKVVFPELVKLLAAVMESNAHERAVVTVCGGSGVGKSEIASLLSYYLNGIGIGSYTLSGDNYPHRIPRYNDAERLRVFRQSAIKGMTRDNTLTPERFDVIQGFQKAGTDADPAHAADYDWYESYIRNGREGLKGYLGTGNEINFEEIGHIVAAFKKGENQIWLKRMGRDETELWYEKKDFSDIKVLIVEWTHGNSDNYQGVDVPILLNSTPRETLEHRRSRNRDGGVDSPFTTMVLELEQAMLQAQAHKAKLIVAKQGNLLSYADYVKLMEEE